MNAEQAGVDAHEREQERRAELVERAERRIAQCASVESRDDLERRLFLMDSDELAAYLDLRDDLDRSHREREARYRTIPSDPELDPVTPPLAPWREPERRDHDDAPAGLDERLHSWMGEAS